MIAEEVAAMRMTEVRAKITSGRRALDPEVRVEGAAVGPARGGEEQKAPVLQISVTEYTWRI